MKTHMFWTFLMKIIHKYFTKNAKVENEGKCYYLCICRNTFMYVYET